MSVTVKVSMKPVEQIVREHGLDQNGDAQKFHTMNVNRRIGRYMPHLTGTLETKLKYIKSNTEIEILGPYAGYQYYGRVMVNAKTGKGPVLIPGVGFRYKKGTILKVTDRPLDYTDTFNPMAGPYWDRALVAAEGDKLRQDLQNYINRKG